MPSVPTSSDATVHDTASFLQQQCQEHRRPLATALGFLSIVACAVALLRRVCCVATKNLNYPHNTFAFALAVLVGYHASVLIGVGNGNSHLKRETLGQRDVCQVQAVLMHWSICALICNAVYVVIVLYLLVVRRVAPATITSSSKLYYVFVLGLPTATVLCCAFVGHGYEPAQYDDICWITSSADRVLYNLSFMAVGISVFTATTPCLLWSLYRAYRVVDDPSRVRLFRSTMMRLIAAAVYTLANFIVNLIVALNGEVFITSHDVSDRAASLAYTMCMLRSYVLQSMGLIVAIIFSIKKRHVRRVVETMRRVLNYFQRRRMCYVKPRDEERDVLSLSAPHSKPSDAREPSDDDSTSSHSQWSVAGRVLCPSAADTGGCTVVSIPPEPAHQRAHLVASQAYTSYVLEHACERLVTQSSVTSGSVSSSSRRTFDSVLSATDASMRSHTSYLSADTPRRRASSAVAQVKIVTEC